ncbi:alpha/beta hydrolase [Flavobacterium sp.]|uniref:alpha/beta hydrolase n=1 Tax=Flavobacterium sp. TaxID=239 RepID=UPI00260E4AF3|nr:alpha/beta hydrolase [Flavobacterium sp.]
MKVISAIVLLFFTTVNFSQTISRDVQLQYGDEKQHRLDLYLPDTINTRTPVLILIHGGAWMMGGNEYTEKHARDLRDKGMVVANVDYRYVSDEVHAADLLNDIDQAIDFVSKQSVTYGFSQTGYHIAGVSAGAHLALMFGYTTSRKIKSITALCAPSRLDTEEMLQFIQKNGLLPNIELLANAKYSGKGKPNIAFTAISPYSQIANIPTLLIHGTDDPLVPYQQSVDLSALLQKNNVDSKLITMAGKGHDVGMNEPDSEKIVLDSIVDWINSHL